MESFYFLIPIAIGFCGLAIGAFFWAIDRQQFDDLDNEGKRILFDDDIPSPSASEAKPNDANDD